MVFDFHWKAATLRYFTGMHAAQLHLIKPFESSSTNEHSRNLILTSSFDRSLKIWSMDSFSCIATIPLLHFPDLPRFLVTDESSFITYSTEYGYSESFSLDISHISKAAATTTSAQPPPSTTATLLTPSTSNTRLLPRFLYVNPDTGSGNRHRHIDQQQRPRLLSSTLICNNRVIMFVSTLPVDHGGLVLVDAQSLQIIKFTTSSSLSTSSTLSSNRPDVNISSCYYCPGKAAPSPSSSSSADYSDSLSSPFSATTTETPPTAFASAVSEKPLLLLGHMNGAVSLVELPLVTFSSTSLSTPTLKTHILKGTHKASICRVVMDDFKICSMAIDGSIKSWDLMNGMLLATLHLKPGTRLRNMIEALDESLVGSQLPPDLCCQLWTSEFRVVACFGDTFKTWIFDPDYLKNTTQSSQKKKNLSKLASAFKSSASSSSSMSASPRSPSTAAQLRFAFKDDINDLSIQRESSEKDEARRRKLFEKLNGHLGRDILIGGNGGGAGVTGNKSPRSPSSIANMTEDELLQYVQILSMDDISLNQPMLSTSPNSLQQLEHHHMPINIHKAPPGPDLTVVDDSAFPPISPSSVGKSPLSAASITSNPWNRPMSNLVKSPSNSKRVSVMSPSISNSNDDDDLQYALELSMVEK